MIANLIRNVNTNYRRHRTSRQVLLAAHDWRLLKLIVHMPEWISIRYGGTWSMSAQATCSWVHARAYEHDGRRSRLLSPCRWTIHNLTHQCIKHAHASARFSIDFRLIFQRLHALLFNSRHLQAIQLDFCWRIFMQYAWSTRAFSFCREMEIVSSVHTQKENGAAMRDTNTHTHVFCGYLPEPHVWSIFKLFIHSSGARELSWILYSNTYNLIHGHLRVVKPCSSPHTTQIGLMHLPRHRCVRAHPLMYPPPSVTKWFIGLAARLAATDDAMRPSK